MVWLRFCQNTILKKTYRKYFSIQAMCSQGIHAGASSLTLSLSRNLKRKKTFTATLWQHRADLRGGIEVAKASEGRSAGKGGDCPVRHYK